jgi:hypothetical protein
VADWVHRNIVAQTLETALAFLSPALQLAVLAEWLRKGISGRYYAFMVYLAFGLIRAIAFLTFDPNTNRYAIVWMVSEPINLLLEVAVVLELFKLICEHHPGIGAFARYFLLGATIVSAGLAAAPLAMDLKGINWAAPELALILVIKRVVSTTLLAFVLSAAMLVRYTGVFLRPNAVLHARLLATFFAISSLSYWLANLMPESRVGVNIGMLAASSTCLAVWAVRMTAAGEVQPQLPSITSEQVAMVERWNAELLEFGQRVSRSTRGGL